MDTWPRFRFFSQWKKIDEYRSFGILSVWYGPEFVGVSICNLAIEFHRRNHALRSV